MRFDVHPPFRTSVNIHRQVIYRYQIALPSHHFLDPRAYQAGVVKQSDNPAGSCAANCHVRLSGLAVLYLQLYMKYTWKT